METRPEAEPELKRPLWVIGAEDYNLGATVGETARNEFGAHYTHVFETDERVDVGNQELLVRYMDTLRKTSPETGIDIVYCAGVNILDAVEDVEEVNMWRTFNVNVMGFIRVLQALRRMYYVDRTLTGPMSQVTSNVVVVASDAARTPMRRSITYCASKAAVVQAMRVAARELAPLIRVNAVSPGIIDGTPMTTSIDAEVKLQRSWTDEQAADYERSQIPMQRRATKWEVTDMIFYALLGPAYLTGSNIEITGGK